MIRSEDASVGLGDLLLARDHFAFRLVSGPGQIGGGVEVNHLAPIMAQHEEGIEQSKGTDVDLKMMWTLIPGGLEDPFGAIRRPRAAREPTPELFPRPENVAEIEAATVFGKMTDS